ncbi:hypothetical protein Golob_012173 [Gossypium lobatum]|uniref:CCHC-type domain-containing protein n=1 Tax=Gossypium lobatum TaxID=34289 RepID=A0A7J8MS16_9ROSI|nr:hypothetical protein [Gossypium lobatum]
MRTTLANLWHPRRGVTITDMGEKRFLFQFYYEIDLDRFLDEIPWMFNNHLLLFHRLKEGDDPMALLLFWVDFWVQIHDLPMGLMPEMMARQFRNFLGQFLEYDVKSLNKGYGGYIRIHVRIDVRNPLMRRKKLISGNKGCTYARFQYEKLSIFCFLCGRLGHLEGFCVTPLTRIHRRNKVMEYY